MSDLERQKKDENIAVKDSISAVVVWFNPNELNHAVENIRSYASRMKKVYIVDNSEDDNSELACSCGSENIVYIPLMENTGIAHALNVGCERAMNDGAVWCMTMDQDSSWNDGELKKYLEIINEKKNEVNVSFAPSRLEPPLHGSILGDIKHFIFGKKAVAAQKTEFSFEDRVITSGNVIDLRVWCDMAWSFGNILGGGYNEALFIDEVDYDFCFRLREKDFCITKIASVSMSHQAGLPAKKTFFPCITFHRKKRIYYIARNIRLMLTLHPFYAEKYNYKKKLLRRCLELVLNLRFVDLKYFIQGIYDARKGIAGKYENRKF